MNEFYYLNSMGQQVGPIPLSEASKHSIGRATMVWMPGMTDWKKAADVPAVMSVISSQTPPPPSVAPTSSFPPQRGSGYHPRQSQKPQNYLWLGIVSTLLCCLPAGIVSIVYAAKVDGLWNQGCYQEAEDASKNAKTWGIVSVALGFVGCIIAFLAGLAEEL